MKQFDMSSLFIFHFLKCQIKNKLKIRNKLKMNNKKNYQQQIIVNNQVNQSNYLKNQNKTNIFVNSIHTYFIYNLINHKWKTFNNNFNKILLIYQKNMKKTKNQYKKYLKKYQIHN